MAEGFYKKLLELKHKTVSIYTECGTLKGLILSVNDDYIEVISICGGEKLRFAPKVITVIPIDKICAVSRFDFNEPEILRRPEKQSTQYICWIIILIIVLISINPVFAE